VTSVTPFNRTLEQELQALFRGASLECLVCGEFVLHDGASIRCPECELRLHGRRDSTVTQLHFGTQAG
jgi:Zn finger protein HypA/HybF involved in hydrogenase expression